MIKKKDPNSFTNYFSLYNGTPDNSGVSQIGYLIAEYNVARYDDVQAQNVRSIAKSTKRKFMLHCTQRIVIYNSASIHPESDANSYNDYPALITTYLSLPDSAGSGLSYKVLDYSPKTVNTKIQTAGSTGNSSGNTQGTSRSSTVGSSTSETNSYGTSVTVGATDMGDFAALSGSVTASFDQSFTTSHEQSSTSGTDSSTSRGQDSSSSASMSIKDWGAYGIVNSLKQQPNWVFGQEYPWDTIECRKEASGSTSNGKVQLIIPTEMLARLYDGTCLYPPSQLSLFGVNFVMKVLWLVELDDTASDDVEITHNIFYSTASHSLNDNNVQVCIDQQPIELKCGASEGDGTNGEIATNLNLPVMGLDVLGVPNKPAIIGFVPNKFTVDPSSRSFKIISTSNALMIDDTTSYAGSYSARFSVAEAALKAIFDAKNSSPLSITLYFKVVDTVNDYDLHVKHWVTATPGVMLTIKINNTFTINKHVTSPEAEGGENNLLTIALRNQDYSSVDYHDYLQLGLNSIEITIAPIGSVSQEFSYQVRAMSIEG